MEEERYTVSQVENLTGIKGHVLRYWEEELELVDYQLGKMSFTVAYRNGEVYGMLIYRYR